MPTVFRNNSPEANTWFGLDEVGKLLRTSDVWDRKYLIAVEDAIVGVHGADRGAKIIAKYLSKASCSDFNLVNSFSRKIFRRQLLNSALDMEGDVFGPQTAVMMMTFTDRNWACSDQALQFDLSQAKKKVRNATAGMNFIAAFEAAVYPTEKWQSEAGVGCLVSFHCHAVMWASSVSKLRRWKAEIAGRFQGVKDDDKRTGPLNHLKSARDLVKVLRYCTKMPFEGYKKTQQSAGLLQAPHDLEAEHHYRLFRFFCQKDLFDHWFAGGEGVEFLKNVKSLSRQEVGA